MKPIDKNSVCLVSGGGRGITAQAAIAIAEEHQCKFILLGRSAISQTEPQWAYGCDNELELKKRILEHLLHESQKPTPMMVQREYKAIAAKREVEHTLQQISQAGGEAVYLSVDVTDAIALSQKLAELQEKLGAVNAIVHGAGNLADKPIEKKSERDYDLVYTPKVKGLENILGCVDTEQLDCLVLFSSVVGFYGNAGQTDYAISNEILNKTAHTFQQKHPNCHVVAINWGPWDSGMVSPELKKAFAERNIKTIPVEAGTQMLVKEVTSAKRDVQVIIGSPLTPPAVTVSHEPQSYRIERRLSLSANPFLQDHVIMDRPVLPATCAVAWIGNACEQIYPGYRFFGCRDFKVLKGIVFDDNLADKYVLDLEKKVTDNSPIIEIAAKIWSKDKAEKIRYHFSNKTRLISKVDDVPSYQSLNIASDSNFIEAKIYQNGKNSLFHGAAFQGVKKVLNVGDRHLTMECNLARVSAIKQGQFPVQTFNPFIVDVQIHSFWLWLQHNHREICLPSEITNYEQFAIVPFDKTFCVSCEIKSKTKTAVIADVFTHDKQGKIYSQMLGAKGTIISF